MSNEELYEQLDKLNLCHKCKKNEQFPNRKYCPECLEKAIIANAKCRNNQTAETAATQRANKNEYMKKLYQERKKNGICLKCTKSATYGLYCYEHSIYIKRQQKKRNEKRRLQRQERGLIPEYRKEHNLCYFCGEPIDAAKSKRICGKCAERLHKCGEKGGKKAAEMYKRNFGR